jgi:hypothetical protein
MPVVCTSSTPILVPPTDITGRHYTKCRFFASPEDEQVILETRKGKAIPLQALTGPEGSRRLRLPDFKIIGT